MGFLKERPKMKREEQSGKKKKKVTVVTQRWASRTGEAAPSSGQGMRTEPWAPPFITDQGLIKPKPHSELLTPQATRLSPTRLSLGQGDWRGRDKGGTPPHHGIKSMNPCLVLRAPQLEARGETGQESR